MTLEAAGVRGTSAHLDERPARLCKSTHTSLVNLTDAERNRALAS
jgi:hypothetical protein